MGVFCSIFGCSRLQHADKPKFENNFNYEFYCMFYVICDWKTPDTTSLLIATTTHSTNNMFYISSIKSSILVLLLVIAVSIRQSVLAFVITSSPNPLLRKVDATIIQTNKQHSLFQPSSVSTSSSYVSSLVVLRNDWAGFGVLEDDDDEDIFIAAKEEDTQEEKAEAGASLKAPDIEDNSSFAGIAPLFVPAGSQLSMDEETVLGVLNACRDEIGTVFGYTAENRGVGITGGVDFVELDGPVVVLRLKGRFWHERTTVLDRVANFLQQRIPEIIDVVVEDEWQLTTEANEQAM